MATRLIEPHMQFSDSAGEPYASGELFFYETGTTTFKDTFSDKTLLTANSNPIVLNSDGRPDVDVWGNGEYKLVVKSATITVGTYDPVSGSPSIPDIANIAALTALLKTNLTSGDEFSVSGYYTQGDGGGGSFYWASASSATVNGGTIIASDEGGTGRWLRIYDGSVAIVGFGVPSDATDGSTEMALALNAGVSLHGREGDIYYFSEVTISSPLIIDGKGCTFKHKRNASLQNNLNWNDWQTPFTAHSTGQETMMTISSDNVTIKNVTVDGNGILFTASAGYSNQMVKMFAVESSSHVLFDNVHIADNNGMGVYTYASEYVTFQNGSILNTRGLTGSVTSHEQIIFVASRYCKALYNEFGGTTPWSCIGSAGGFVTVTDGSEVGGFLPFNTSTIDPDYTHFGRATGDSDTFHEIIGNTCHSSVIDANEAGGGGVLGRVITMNCGSPIIRDNIVYDITDLSQGGIGIGHDAQPTPGEVVYAQNSSRAEVSGNTVFGFRKSGQGFGIMSIDAEDVNVHDNIVYNCNTAVYHFRWAISGRYHDNHVTFSNIAFGVDDVDGAAKSHGIYGLIEITQNTCLNNLQDVLTLNQSTASAPDLKIEGNTFVQSSSATSQVQFDIYHGRLDFNNNSIDNKSTGIIGEFFTIGTGEYVNCNDNEVVWDEDSSVDLFFFDGSSGDTTGRGRLTINNFKGSGPSGSNNRRFNLRRLNTKGCIIGNINLVNAYLNVGNIAGNVVVNGGHIEPQGTNFPILIQISNASDPKMITVSDMQFPSFGSATAASTTLSAGTGWITFNNCFTAENKEISDRANGNQMQSNDCYKVTSSNLATSRP